MSCTILHQGPRSTHCLLFMQSQGAIACRTLLDMENVQRSRSSNRITTFWNTWATVNRVTVLYKQQNNSYADYTSSLMLTPVIKHAKFCFAKAFSGAVTTNIGRSTSPHTTNPLPNLGVEAGSSSSSTASSCDGYGMDICQW